MHTYWDCRHGLSGPMALAALCHLGVDVAFVQDILRAAGAPCRLNVREASSQDVLGRGCECAVESTRAQAQPAHPTALGDVVRRAAVSETVRAQALAVLDALVQAQAHATGTTPEALRLDGAPAELLAYLLGVPWGLEALGITHVAASPLPWCRGTLPRSATRENPLPLPRPATVQLMQGKPLVDSGCEGELLTPLGAALAHVLVDDFQTGPSGPAPASSSIPAGSAGLESAPQPRLVRVGTGYDPRCAGAGLRILLLEDAAPSACASTGGVRREWLCMLETHIDHLSGEELGMAVQALAALPEVLDVLWLPGLGKKNRPAGALRVLCLPCHREAAERAFFAHTHSLGIRCQIMERSILPREACTVDAASGPLRAKRYTVGGADYVRVECDALRAAAEAQGVAPLGIARGELRRG